MSNRRAEANAVMALKELPSGFHSHAALESRASESALLGGTNLSLNETESTDKDASDMQRMGHKQELIRRFRLMSMISFVAIATANWELAVFLLNQGLIDGGRAGLIWSYVWNFIGFLPIYASMAEMASMAPIAGSQYHWVSEFAPARYQKILSYYTGWFSTLAYQAGNAQGMFLAGTLIQTLISINDPEYAYPRYQGTLLVIATVVVVFAINYFSNNYLPYVQNVMLGLHTVLYFCLIIPVWLIAPQTSGEVVFTKFSNTGGWPSMGLAVLAGQLSGISGMVGIDTAAHMSEEIKDASRTVPMAMILAYFLNIIYSLPAVITICYAMPDLEAALSDPTGYPVIYVLRKTMSTGWATAWLAGVIVILFASNVAYLAAVSRDLFAFSRDFGTPFPKWTSRIHPRRRIPNNSLLVSCIIACLLSLVYLGSSTAFYALTSLLLVSLLECYSLSIASILWRRLTDPESLPPARWSLGKLGIPCNVAALAYVFWSFFWAFWPEFYQPNASTFNWSVVMFGAIAILSTVWYFFQGRYVYQGPVTLVEGRRVVLH